MYVNYHLEKGQGMKRLLTVVTTLVMALILTVSAADVKAEATLRRRRPGVEVIKSGGTSLGGLSWYLERYYSGQGKGADTDAVSLFAETIEISDDIAIANVNDKLNIRKEPGTDKELIGYLPRHAYCYVLENDGTWAKIKSGNLTGYVAVEYLHTGEEGKAKAKEVGVLTADVEAGKVNLRSEPSTASENTVIAVATKGMELEVLEENVLSKNEDEAALWSMVRYEDSTAYIAKQFVKISYKWVSAKEVERPVLELENVPVPQGTAYEDEPVEYVEVSGDVSTLRKTIAKTAQKYVGLRYSYGGNSLSSGCDCSGFCLAVYKACGVDWASMGIPRSSGEMAASSKGKTVSLKDIKPGDIVCYGSGGYVNHVALYIGGGKVANMSSVGMKMRIDQIDYRPIIKIKNFLG